MSFLIQGLRGLIHFVNILEEGIPVNTSASWNFADSTQRHFESVLKRGILGSNSFIQGLHRFSMLFCECPGTGNSSQCFLLATSEAQNHFMNVQEGDNCSQLFLLLGTTEPQSHFVSIQEGGNYSQCFRVPGRSEAKSHFVSVQKGENLVSAFHVQWIQRLRAIL